MPWFPVDDAFHSHPKAVKAGDEALGMWTRAGAHCMAYLTDGFVADWWVKQQPKGVVKAQRLVNAELWRPAKKNGESGYQFHDWKRECTKEYVAAVRENARQRKAKSRESQGSSHVTGRVTDASCLVPTQPNPTQPINPLVDLGESVTQVGPDDSPPQFCSRHPNGTDKPCKPCGMAREAFEGWKSAQRQDELAQRRKLREIADNCPICEGTMWVPNTEPAVPCNHQSAAHA